MSWKNISRMLWDVINYVFSWWISSARCGTILIFRPVPSHWCKLCSSCDCRCNNSMRINSHDIFGCFLCVVKLPVSCEPAHCISKVALNGIAVITDHCLQNWIVYRLKRTFLTQRAFFTNSQMFHTMVRFTDLWSLLDCLGDNFGPTFSVKYPQQSSKMITRYRCKILLRLSFGFSIIKYHSGAFCIEFTYF